jgi:hypothetical protein
MRSAARLETPPTAVRMISRRLMKTIMASKTLNPSLMYSQNPCSKEREAAQQGQVSQLVNSLNT